MIRAASFVFAVLALVAAGSEVSAQTFSPGAGASGSGVFTHSQAATVNCNWSVTAGAGATLATISSRTISPGNAWCGMVLVDYGAWSMATIPGRTNAIRLTIGFNTSSPCHGSFDALWNNVTRTASFSSVMLPPVSAPGLACMVSGTLVFPTLQVIP